jgi:class 3 adenylate cyclase
MAKLGGKDRKTLRDSAFAYIDAKGRRRLPINDESHVRNALSRFNQVIFEDEGARTRARTRLLNAAKRYGIVPVGFVTGQLRAHGARDLPSGALTLLMTDIEGSTGLLLQLGERYGSVLLDTRRMARAAVRRAGGWEVDARADEFFAVFRHPHEGINAAVAIQRRLGEQAWPEGVEVRIRMGLHHGRPTLAEGGYVGVSVHAVSRVCGAATGGQILVSRAVVAAVGEELPAGLSLVKHGEHVLKGLGTQSLFRITGPGLTRT